MKDDFDKLKGLMISLAEEAANSDDSSEKVRITQSALNLSHCINHLVQRSEYLNCKE